MLTLAWVKNCVSSDTSVPSDGPPHLSLMATTPATAAAAVDVLAGPSLYALGGSAGPRPFGAAKGVILFCASVRTRAFQRNTPPLHTAPWGCCSMEPSSSA